MANGQTQVPSKQTPPATFSKLAKPGVSGSSDKSVHDRTSSIIDRDFVIVAYFEEKAFRDELIISEKKKKKKQ